AQFVELVRQYIALIDGLERRTAREFLQECAVLLPHIYSLSHHLPDIEVSETDSAEEQLTSPKSPMGKILELLGKYDRYSEVFDPVFETEAITSTLSDDLSDIYIDLKGPLILYESEIDANQKEAIWQWKFNMQIHWGHHLVDALRPIHTLIYDHLD